ncbi:homoserine O-acetyltransferase [Candidatus Sumerlaeota bacterium]|nr:homoserine O-acetyltransferase [Candidatus Sumerlaeota bacterium]
MFPSNSVGIVETKIYNLPEPFSLECGRLLEQAQIAYETYGVLNDDKSNAILVIHALSGDAHAAGYHSDQDRKPGWWDSMIGPGKAFDTDKFYVVCSNCLGGCMGTTGPGSLKPGTNAPYSLDFPPFSITDMVDLQKRLIDRLGIEKLVTVVGGSMGGMQALEWGIRYPQNICSTIIIASSAYLSSQALAFDAVGRNAILSDPNWNRGDYYGKTTPSSGLAIARMLGHITYLSLESMEKKFGREKNKDASPEDYFSTQYQVESYLDYQGRKFIARFDANSYLYITKAMDNYDAPARFGSLENAFKHSENVKFLVTSISSDWLFPPSQSLEMVKALRSANHDVTYFQIQSQYGHDAFLLETDTLTRLIKAFLKRISGKESDISTQEISLAALPSNVLIRSDYSVIYGMIKKGKKVLDLGCGDGRLLRLLMEHKGVRGYGIEINPDMVVKCVEVGIPVVQGDIDTSLSEYADKTFDYVVLNQTLQATDNPEKVLKEMLRIGKKGVIGFPNFGNWKIRLKMLFNGAMPISETLPDKWYETRNIHLFTMRDFRDICRKLGVRILDRRYIRDHHIFQNGLFPNLTSDLCIFVLEGF